jgi:hypothetical protein
MSLVIALICRSRVGSSILSPPTIFQSVDFFEVRMSSDQYRKIAAECLDRARHARKSEDVDAWLLIAEDWLRLAAEFDAPERQSE